MEEELISTEGLEHFGSGDVAMMASKVPFSIADEE